MLTYAWDGNRLLRRALVASLALHVLIAVFLPTWMQAQSQGLQAVESISFAHVMHVAIMRPAQHALPNAVPDTRKRSPEISFARSKAELSANRHKRIVRPARQNAPVGQIAAAPKHVLSRKPAPLYAQAAESATPVSTTQNAPAAATPRPESTLDERAAGGVSTSNRGGMLPFGAQQDPVLDPSVMGKLQARITSHVTLLVTVGEDGKTKRVEFQPPLDAQTEHEIEAILAGASWDAAVCGGGVSCEGVATIKL